MTRQSMHITLVAGAIALAVGFASAPAFAQARNPNDGGPVSVPAGAKLDSGVKSSSTSSSYVGRPANDGGPGAQPSTAQINAAGTQNKTANQASAPHVGRPLNDGGI